MTEPVAECTFVLTKSIFAEGIRRTQIDTMKKTMRWVLPSLAVLWLMISGFSIATGGGIGLALSELVVLAAFIGYIMVWLPHSRAMRAWRDLEAKGHADAERTILFFEDHLQAGLTGRQTEMEYSEIVKSLESKKLLILICGDQTGIMIKKENLIGCTCQMLLQTITENGGLKT